MFRQFTGKYKSHSGLNLPGSNRRLLIVPSKPRGLLSQLLEDIVDKRVHNPHSLARDSNVRMNLLQNLEDVDLSPPTSCSSSSSYRLLTHLSEVSSRLSASSRQELSRRRASSPPVSSLPLVPLKKNTKTLASTDLRQSLRACKLSYSLGTFRYRVFRQFTGKYKSHGGLNLPGSNRRLLVVPSKPRRLLSQLLEDIVDKRSPPTSCSSSSSYRLPTHPSGVSSRLSASSPQELSRRPASSPPVSSLPLVPLKKGVWFKVWREMDALYVGGRKQHVKYGYESWDGVPFIYDVKKTTYDFTITTAIMASDSKRLLQLTRVHKSELREKPTVLSGLETLLQPCFRLLASSHLLVMRLKRIDRDDILEIYVERVPSRHDMVVVHELDECLHARFLRRLLRRILSDHLLRVLGDSGNETVTIGTVTSSVIKLSYDHRFPSGETAVENHHRLVRLQKLHHFRRRSSLTHKCGKHLVTSLRIRGSLRWESSKPGGFGAGFSIPGRVNSSFTDHHSRQLFTEITYKKKSPSLPSSSNTASTIRLPLPTARMPDCTRETTGHVFLFKQYEDPRKNLTAGFQMIVIKKYVSEAELVRVFYVQMTNFLLHLCQILLRSKHPISGEYHVDQKPLLTKHPTHVLRLEIRSNTLNKFKPYPLPLDFSKKPPIQMQNFH
ncbi:hypothetical protein Ccrd_014179 [Cynara cardunculus var. scolymus]|uniref:Uncharacterized protein n=1 Tax=Cynara cardunculus var. scolymus TaxID=59895 RepID=A0A118K4G1_CYNCS|nr:hypothetical protein Ccrd_014179 [Cynara cardunculus var. scolymus]